MVFVAGELDYDSDPTVWPAGPEVALTTRSPIGLSVLGVFDDSHGQIEEAVHSGVAPDDMVPGPLVHDDRPALRIQGRRENKIGPHVANVGASYVPIAH
jgi:hypothetical protein